MTLGKLRDRSGSELSFALLRALMTGYQLWGTESRLLLTDLTIFLQTSPVRLNGVVAYLAVEGLVSLDGANGTVQLTERGARDLMIARDG